MNSEEKNSRLKNHLRRHPEIPFPPEACLFVCDSVFDVLAGLDRPRHISAAEVLEAVHKRCLREFGVWTGSVMTAWHIHTCRHIGEIIFILVDSGILSARPEDRIEDFDVPDATWLRDGGAPALPEEPPKWKGAPLDR